jgi:RES domain-containing protein
MQAWRLCREPFADLSGDGARVHGGRWNAPGRPLVYAASTDALAVLEVRVHLDIPPDLIPDDYMLLGIDLGDLPVETVRTMPVDPLAFRNVWLREQRTPVLQVPSAIVPESTNLLLNPAHPLAGGASIVTRRPFDFDRRLWLPL